MVIFLLHVLVKRSCYVASVERGYLERFLFRDVVRTYNFHALFEIVIDVSVECKSGLLIVEITCDKSNLRFK
jgi:hypothetical protein